ncbi:MAG: hypothetical protein GXP29_10265 [Planctomycetes bacterium]|nr:hypothetical protein [Planctomycetota bacterium]
MRLACGQLKMGVVLGLIPWLVAGCLSGNRKNPNLNRASSIANAEPDAAMNSRVPTPTSGARTAGTVRMQFDVYRVELPIESGRQSLDLWKHLDESLGDPQLTALLARNGLRIGKGDRDAWPAMRVMIERAGGRMGTYRHVVDNGLSLLVGLDQTAGGESYFVHGRGGSLRGGTFQAGTKRFLIDYETREDDSGGVLLKITPELWESRTRTRYVESEGNVRTVEDHGGIVFEALAALVSLNAGEFVMIGSSAQADSGYLIGSYWLTSMLSMKQHETVLFIRPQLVRMK